MTVVCNIHNTTTTTTVHCTRRNCGPLRHAVARRRRLFVRGEVGREGEGVEVGVTRGVVEGLGAAETLRVGVEVTLGVLVSVEQGLEVDLL